MEGIWVHVRGGMCMEGGAVDVCVVCVCVCGGSVVSHPLVKGQAPSPAFAGTLSTRNAQPVERGANKASGNTATK